MCKQGDDAAAAKFQEVSKAYDTLRDPQKRQQYDGMGADNYERMSESGGAGFSQVRLHGCSVILYHNAQVHAGVGCGVPTAGIPHATLPVVLDEKDNVPDSVPLEPNSRLPATMVDKWCTMHAQALS